MKTVYLLQLKAFGDFVIATAAGERVAASERARIRMAIGRHLRPLCHAIAPQLDVTELTNMETGVPTLFDVRRAGIAASLRSAWNVRRSVANSALPSDALILMDHIGFRERFAIGSRASVSFPAGTPNIYAGYEALLRDAGFTLTPVRNKDRFAPQRVGIFPGSRIAAKNLPPDLVSRVMAESRGRGLETQLFLLDGERSDLEAGELPHRIVPRSFTALCDAIASVDLVISADSLPAHLAERAGKDVFVFTPRPNAFWMPPSVLRHDRWSLFYNPAALQRLDACWSGKL